MPTFTYPRHIELDPILRLPVEALPSAYVGRHRAGDRIHLGWVPAPADCTCRIAACGYVADRIDPACPVHDPTDTTRLHDGEHCPGGDR